jgi:hypothetical protein
MIKKLFSLLDIINIIKKYFPIKMKQSGGPN